MPRDRARWRNRTAGAAARCRCACRCRCRARGRPGAAAGDGGGRTHARRARLRRAADRRADPGALPRSAARESGSPMIRLWLAVAGLGGLASVAAGALAAPLTAERRAAEFLDGGAFYGLVSGTGFIAVM